MMTTRRPEDFGAIDLFAAVGRQREVSLNDEASIAEVFASIASSFEAARGTPTLLHGRRIEEMFWYVASSLQKAEAVKREDAGDVHSRVDVAIPDFRVIVGATEFLVEVKNCHTVFGTASFTKTYIERLAAYAALFERPVKLAIYWSRWVLWTLVPLEALTIQGSRYRISMSEAMRQNEMATLGDVHVGTVAPLGLRVVADPSKPRAVSEGEAVFTIGAVEFLSGGSVIRDARERNLAFYLMEYGDWSGSQGEPLMLDGELVHIDYLVAPTESMTPEQGFDFVGLLSSMIARQFNEVTTSERGVERISANHAPNAFGITIPEDYKGRDLKLWRMIQRPAEPVVVRIDQARVSPDRSTSVEAGPKTTRARAQRNEVRMKRVVREEEYVTLFAGKKGELALAAALDTRRFEIELYWKRAAYFWALIAATFAGYVAVASDVSTEPNLRLLLACVGMVLSLAWYLVNRGSKFWQENWERHVALLEADLQGPLFALVADPSKDKWLHPLMPFRYSVTNVNTIVSLLVWLVWVGLIVATVSGQTLGVTFGRNLLLVATALASAWLCIFGLSGGGIDRSPDFVMKERSAPRE